MNSALGAKIIPFSWCGSGWKIYLTGLVLGWHCSEEAWSALEVLRNWCRDCVNWTMAWFISELTHSNVVYFLLNYKLQLATAAVVLFSLKRHRLTSSPQAAEDEISLKIHNSYSWCFYNTLSQTASSTAKNSGSNASLHSSHNLISHWWHPVWPYLGLSAEPNYFLCWRLVWTTIQNIYVILTVEINIVNQFSLQHPSLALVFVKECTKTAGLWLTNPLTRPLIRDIYVLQLLLDGEKDTQANPCPRAQTVLQWVLG